jgi:flagellar motor component MotA
MKSKYIYIPLGITLFITAIYTVLFFDSDPRMFCDIPSLIFVIFVGASLGLACYRGGGFLKYIKACKKHFFTAGLLLSIIIVTNMLQNLSSPDAIGRGVAIGLLPIYYGIILYCIADAITS